MSAAPNAPAPVSAQGAVLFPGNLSANPRLSQWLGFSADGIVEISPGKVEIGQGILTALAQIVADELDVELARVRLVPATTARSTARTMRLWAPQRQRCRSSAARTSASLGSGLRRSSAAALIRMPEMQ